MIRFSASGLSHAWSWLLGECDHASRMVAKPDSIELKPEDNNRLTALLVSILDFCEKLQLEETKGRAKHFKSALSNRSDAPNFHAVKTELLGLQVCFWNELSEQHYVFIPIDKAPFFEQEELFGKSVNNRFKDAQADIKCAGNCLAADLNDAAVFHLCRVAEFGLRALAVKLRMKLKYPLEYAEWGRVIDPAQEKLDTLKPKTRGKKKAEELEFYSNAVSDCKAIKETWRDCIMHTRKSFNQAEALGVFARVRDFMHRLSTRV